MRTPGQDGARGVKLGTRGSALALAQARVVGDLLESHEPGLEVELVPIRTSGDERAREEGAAAAAREGRAGAGGGLSSAPRGDKSRFVKEIEEALLGCEIDLAVHSAKDVPGDLPHGLAIVGVPERADARDALLGATAIDELPDGAVVGTGSLRRQAQLLARRPDLVVRDLRGNVDTRLGRLEREEFDAIVLARAGLARLEDERGEPIPPAVMTPAPGQGCLVLEARSDDRGTTALASRVTHRDSAVRLTAERALVSALRATCRTPIGAHAELAGGAVVLSAFVGLPDGATWIRDSVSGTFDGPAEVGREAADRLAAAGAVELLAEAEGMARAGGPNVGAPGAGPLPGG
jgi:hydroxymethylbilane synthase